MTNFDLSLHAFEFLKQAGAETVVVCAGARNAPMVLALQSQNFKIFNFFEERSAAFFALGLIKATGKAVAVMTTSGTAVAELLPAAIEASYQNLPLILITADRPKSYRGTGSPQTIEQVGIFSHYVEKVYDLDVTTKDFQFDWSQTKPIQLNVSFDEPLIDKSSNIKVNVSLDRPTAANNKREHHKQFPHPLIVVGELSPEHKAAVVDFIVKTKAPVYAESLSQIKEVPEIETYIIHSSDQLVRHIFKLKICESVIRIGGVPTLRFWRDLEGEFKNLPVANFTDTEYSGLSRPSNMQPIKNLMTADEEFPLLKLMQVKQIDVNLEQEKESLYAKYPLGEQHFTNKLSAIVKDDPVYLGNSLPIRNWDQFAKCESSKVNANRGANGIDGQISTYLGWSEFEKVSYCYVGDLTAMYDLASLGLKPQLNSHKRNIVVLNNFGGQIFSRVFKNNDFINAHQTQFHHWAQMWGWNYLQVTKLEDLAQIKNLTEAYNVIEIIPDQQQTQSFWNEWDQRCQQL
ncbi:2-succinyl-5-enolpyruvyl-6-hydroxy-3-cyclohexene-1-carboxylic-acid synthase [bacterium]|nr:2-succinyl-5-enolpyruvyl-6-hydroxy-3-cyclohexene-1-carboxylic-acid synthase [bacterium]